MKKEKISTILLAHKNLIKSTLISSPVTLYSNYVKLIKLNGITKLTLVNKIKLFSQIKFTYSKLHDFIKILHIKPP
jgi:hypothetical protein